MERTTRRSLFRMLLGAPLAIAAGPAVAKLLPEAPKPESVDQPDFVVGNREVIAYIEKRIRAASIEMQHRLIELDYEHNSYLVGGAYSRNDRYFGNGQPVTYRMPGPEGLTEEDFDFGNRYATYGVIHRNCPVGKELHA